MLYGNKILIRIKTNIVRLGRYFFVGIIIMSIWTKAHSNQLLVNTASLSGRFLFLIIGQLCAHVTKGGGLLHPLEIFAPSPSRPSFPPFSLLGNENYCVTRDISWSLNNWTGPFQSTAEIAEQIYSFRRPMQMCHPSRMILVGWLGSRELAEMADESRRRRRRRCNDLGARS